MTLKTIERSPDGKRWIRVGYASPRVRTSGGVYRYVRLCDGARIRVPSNKFYECNVSRRNWAAWTSVPSGYDETVDGGGAARLVDDRIRAWEVFAAYQS